MRKKHIKIVKARCTNCGKMFVCSWYDKKIRRQLYGINRCEKCADDFYKEMTENILKNAFTWYNGGEE